MRKTYLLSVLIIFSAFTFYFFLLSKNNISLQEKVNAAGTCDLVNTSDGTINHCHPLNRGCDTRFEVANTTVDTSCGTFLNIPSPNDKAVCCRMKTFSVVPTAIPGKCPTIRSDQYINYCIPRSQGTCASNSYSDTTTSDNDACTDHLYGVPGYCCKTNKKIVVTPAAGSTPGAASVTPGASAGGTYRLSGRVYIDVNKNNQFDSGDKAEAGIALVLTNTGSVTTDSSGQYSFPTVASGSHTLTGTVREGSNQISLNRTFSVMRNMTGEDFIIVINSVTGGATVGGGATPTPASGGGGASVNVQEIINSVSETKIREYLTSLVDDDNATGADELQSRWSIYNGQGGRLRGNLTEAEYIKSVFQSNGLEASFQPFTFSYGGTSVASNNVVGRIAGKNPNNVYLITAHMDSRGDSNTGGSNTHAPGADDNGSGVSAVMEAARAIKNSGVITESSIEFVAFSGEEQNLFGSQYYANHLNGKNIKGVINLDMIGNKGSSDCQKFIYPTTGLGSELSARAVEVNSQYNIGLAITSVAANQSYDGGVISRSDQYSFLVKNIPATFGYECVMSPVYHEPGDKMGLLSFSQITKTTKVAVGTVLSFALE